MKVSELISKLQTMPQDYEVRLVSAWVDESLRGNDTDSPIIDIDIEHNHKQVIFDWFNWNSNQGG